VKEEEVPREREREREQAQPYTHINHQVESKRRVMGRGLEG
jgi:hypothetical protein